MARLNAVMIIVLFLIAISPGLAYAEERVAVTRFFPATAEDLTFARFPAYLGIIYRLAGRVFWERFPQCAEFWAYHSNYQIDENRVVLGVTYRCIRFEKSSI